MNTDEWVSLDLLVMSSPVLRALSPIKESETPLCALCKFPGPALLSHTRQNITDGKTKNILGLLKTI